MTSPDLPALIVAELEKRLGDGHTPRDVVRHVHQLLGVIDAGADRPATVAGTDERNHPDE